MLTARQTDHLAAAVADLDPGGRALLDLSIRRGVDDEMIAGILHTEAGEVASRRDALLADLAARVGSDDPAAVGAAIPDLPPRAWGAAAPGPARDETAVRPARVQEPVPEPSRERPLPPSLQVDPLPPPSPAPHGRRGGRGLGGALTAVLAVAAVAGVVALFVALGGFGDDGVSEPEATVATTTATTPTETGETTATAEETATTEAEETSEPLGMRRVARGTRARGTARITGEGRAARLEVTLSRLPDGGRYRVWLYNSLADAVPVRTFRGPDADIDVPLTADPSDYEFVDVSREPGDGNDNHSGESLLRVPVADLLAG